MKKKFKVFGVAVPIKSFIGDEENKDLMGYCTKEPLEIYFNSALDVKNRDKTILHELHHALIMRLGFDQVLDESTQELLAEAFSDVIYENFRPKK